jgi:hypothetical protein
MTSDYLHTVYARPKALWLPVSSTTIVQTRYIALTTDRSRGTSIRLPAGLRICHSSVTLFNNSLVPCCWHNSKEDSV